jgi:hypothetical protein
VESSLDSAVGKNNFSGTEVLKMVIKCAHGTQINVIHWHAIHITYVVGGLNILFIFK